MITIVVLLVALLGLAARPEPGLPFDCTPGQTLIYSTSTPGVNMWQCANVASGGVPAGSILLTLASCPAGYVEEGTLNGQTLIGTLAANANVGTTGGTDSITPAGSNATVNFTPAGTIAWPASVPTFAGSASSVVVNHVHTLATGTTATGNFSQVLGTVDTSSGSTGGTPTQTALGTLSGNPTTGGAASYTPAGVVAWPATVPSLSGTPGVVPAQVFTGTQFDNRSAFVRVIFCRKT